MTTVGVYLASIILKRARLAHDRITATEDLESGQMDAIDAIVFAAASTEAFINEFIATAYERSVHRSELIAPPDADPVQRTGIVLHELGNEAAIRKKYSLSHYLLCGERYNAGTQPWQDFAALITLRNAILHLQMDRFELDEDDNRAAYPKCVQGLSNRGILAAIDTQGSTMPWIAVVATRSAAKWAINSACNIVLSVLNAIPSNDPLHTSWRKGFEPIS